LPTADAGNRESTLVSEGALVLTIVLIVLVVLLLTGGGYGVSRRRR